MPPPVLPPFKPKVSELEMPMAVYNLLQQRCSQCHTYGLRDPSGWGSVLDVTRMIAADIVVPGNPDGSRMWNRVAVRADMPFNGQRLSGPEVGLLRAWISNIPRQLTGRPRSNEDILDLLVQDQRSTGNRNDTRYISFANYVDERRSPEELKATKATFSLILNSLSRGRSIFQPATIDREGSIFRFRLSDMGWSERDWDRLTSFYPYCIRSDRQQHRDLYNRLNTESPFVRGDWFMATATKPPLYHDLLDLSDNLDDITRRDLGVDINDDIQNERVQRIAFTASGVSLNNRMYERHRTRDGGYLWVSYDFDSSFGDNDIRRFPLGPRNRDDRFEHSFQNLAGEMFWSLPNGLQGYLLADANGVRLDKAVTTVVRDPRRPDDGAVQNGISCFGCHGITGMNRPRVFNEVQGFVAQHTNDFNRNEIDEIRRTYPNNMQSIHDLDSTRYLGKVRTLLGDLLPGQGVVEYDDFITLYGEYEAKVGLHAGAIELQTDLGTVTREVRVRGDNELELPLLLSDSLVKRDDWTCRFRRIIRDVRRVNFCSNTFNADELNGFCDNR